MASKARIFEVGPRDGLQSELKNLSLAQKIQLIKLLCQSGLKHIEVGSFVKPSAIPQLKDSDKLVESLRDWKKKQFPDTQFWSFIPNLKGLERAVRAGVDGVGYIVAVSETFNKKNVNRSVEELFNELKLVLKEAKQAGLKHRVYLSTLSHCPYEGSISSNQVLETAKRLLDMGVEEIALSDTTGRLNPSQITQILDKLLKFSGADNYSLHLHDTRGMALVNIYAALPFGINKFDASIAGLGGCPYAPGASGNLATEDLAYMLADMKILEESIDLEKLIEAGLYAEKVIGRKLPSKILRSEGPVG